MNLYEIKQSILECVDEETGEVLDVEKLDNLLIARTEKLEQLALWYKNLKAEAKAYDEEGKKFAEWKRAAESKAEQIKLKIDAELDGNKFSTDRIKISYRKSKSTEIVDFSQLTDEYLRYKEPEADKTKIKTAIESGIEVAGAMLVEKNNITIR